MYLTKIWSIFIAVCTRRLLLSCGILYHTGTTRCHWLLRSFTESPVDCCLKDRPGVEKIDVCSDVSIVPFDDRFALSMCRHVMASGSFEAA